VGKLHGFWYAFGTHDGYSIYEVPDNVSMAAVALAISGGGALFSLETTVLDRRRNDGCPAQGRASPVPSAWHITEDAPGVPRARSFKNKEPARRTTGRGWWRWLLGLQQPHIGGLGALRPRRHVELNGLALIK
jgi:GYD domain